MGNRWINFTERMFGWQTVMLVTERAFSIRRSYMVGEFWYINRTKGASHTRHRLMKGGKLSGGPMEFGSKWEPLSGVMGMLFLEGPEVEIVIPPIQPQWGGQQQSGQQFGQGLNSATAVQAAHLQQSSIMNQQIQALDKQMRDNALGALGQQAGLGMGGAGLGAQTAPPPPNPLAAYAGLGGVKISQEEYKVLHEAGVLKDIIDA